MTIEKNKVVSLLYELRIGNATGELVEKVDPAEPFAFLFGAGGLLPEFESNLKGKKSGDKFAFGIKSENAYGNISLEAIVDIPKSVFMVNGELATEMLQVGKMIPMRDDQGHPMHGKVLVVDIDKVKMDFNHPMAGKDLHFTGEVLEVRNALAEELSHGHVHGPGGHHH